MAIQSFKSRELEQVFRTRLRVRGLPGDLLARILRKLDQLNAAAQLSDMEVPPGNRLEALRGDRSGQHSIRINGQFRICFVWTAVGPAEVEFVDYH